MNKKIKIALIGCGQWGKNIARNLLEMKALMCVYDPESNQAKDFTLKNNLPDLFKKIKSLKKNSRSEFAKLHHDYSQKQNIKILKKRKLQSVELYLKKYLKKRA